MRTFEPRAHLLVRRRILRDHRAPRPAATARWITTGTRPAFAIAVTASAWLMP